MKSKQSRKPTSQRQRTRTSSRHIDPPSASFAEYPVRQPISERQLQDLVAEHLGIRSEPGFAGIPGIAPHVLPAEWTQVR